ncbi:MAG: AarF/ABC1/UbiB kinase family protein [Streptosporangiales bacterium]|nr:AarF/ABC1/UbiB kinase family protein [Streptosporangiales bacterium]
MADKHPSPYDRDRAVSGGRMRRASPLAGLAGKTTGEAVVAALRRRFGAGDSTEFHVRTADRYADLLGRSKGVLMKAGQILSFVTLGSLVPPEYRGIYQAALSRLQAEAPPMEPEMAAAVVEAELGSPPEVLFAEFDPHPFAAASIGQVHAARLGDGRRVAVKVQYPGVEEAIRADLDNTELLATFLQLARSLVPGLGRLDVRTVALEVAERIGEEIDYRTEAAYQQRFADAYRGHPFIHVPEVVTELSTRRVLTQGFVEGIPWSEAVRADRSLRDRWGEVIYRFAFGSLRRLRLFNADPHPGNYLFHPDGTVSFVDFGCVKHFTADQVSMMRSIVAATIAGDARAMWRMFVEIGFVDAVHGPDPADLLDWYREVLMPLIAPQPFTYTPEFAAEVVQKEFSPYGPWSRVIRRVDLPRDFVFLTRIDLGLTAVLGELRATGPWRAIIAEYDDGAPPATPLGEAALWHENTGRTTS